MKTSEFKVFSHEELKRYINLHHENEYEIIDVRQPVEYETAHIPGASLKPLNQLIQSFSELPHDKDIIFYCHVGSRSQMAAMMAAEEEAFEKGIYTLDGGIVKWSGKALSKVPRIGVFSKSKTLPEFLQAAMNMEKGAERFYRWICKKYPSESFSQVFEDLAGVEIAHAKLIYKFYKEIAGDQSEFENFYAGLAGEIVEGGESLESCLMQISNITDRFCLTLLEFALGIEFSAYDLYRTLANQKTDAPEMSAAFLSIAQAEKSHMRMISEALANC